MDVWQRFVILGEFDGAKMIDEIEFTSIPIWVRVQRCPSD